MEPLSQEELARRNEKLRRSWAKQAPSYDASMGFFERRVFGPGHREWACARASGETLEVAVGTALNLPHLPDGIPLTGIDISPEMLAIARRRSAELGRGIRLREGDAHRLPFADASFDTVLCTYSLCNIPDPRRAVAEMKRVVRPGGRLILVDHICSRVKPVYWVQRVIEIFSMLEGEHMTRRPLEYVQVEGFLIIERDRLGPAGIIERLMAVKP